jgi:flagellar assembly protein FliH
MSNKPTFKNVPAPPGSRHASTYQRFIPREELGDFESWKPGTFGNGAAQAQAAPPEPTQADWQARVDAARQAGYQDGYRDGLSALESFKQSFAQQATAQVGALLDAFDAQMQALDAEMGRALADTAVQLARQVLRSEIRTHPEIVAKVAGEAVGAIMLSARHINVQVHPHDLPLVAEGAAEALAARGARLTPNPAIARGGVLVQSDVGGIDARIGARWALAAAALGTAVPLEGATEDEAS